VNTAKDFPKIKAMLKKLFTANGFNNVDIQLSQSQEKKIF